MAEKMTFAEAMEMVKEMDWGEDKIKKMGEQIFNVLMIKATIAKIIIAGDVRPRRRKPKSETPEEAFAKIWRAREAINKHFGFAN